MASASLISYSTLREHQMALAMSILWQFCEKCQSSKRGQILVCCLRQTSRFIIKYDADDEVNIRELSHEFNIKMSNVTRYPFYRFSSYSAIHRNATTVDEANHVSHFRTCAEGWHDVTRYSELTACNKLSLLHFIGTATVDECVRRILQVSQTKWEELNKTTKKDRIKERGE
jgi:hypothetical protein